MGGVVRRARVGDRAAGLVLQPHQGPGRFGRRGDQQAGMGVRQRQPQPHPQQGQGFRGAARARRPPGAEFVGPGGAELRPAQAVGILGREGVGDAAVGEFQPAARAFEHRPRLRRPARQGPQAGRPLDHHLAHIVQGRADQGQPTAGPQRLGLIRQPFGARLGLARAPPAQKQPGPPRLAPRRRLGRPLRRAEVQRRRGGFRLRRRRLAFRHRRDPVPHLAAQPKRPGRHTHQSGIVALAARRRGLGHAAIHRSHRLPGVIRVKGEGQISADHMHHRAGHRRQHDARRPLGQTDRVLSILLAHVQRLGVAMQAAHRHPDLGHQRSGRLPRQPSLQHGAPLRVAHAQAVLLVGAVARLPLDRNPSSRHPDPRLLPAPIIPRARGGDGR